ncbi:hypothetical protein [Pseudolysinimonas sp.]|uniref:hypothetical protein n=1 Tax=Pseudolysinimonas sp. TaxID=2680009 RepID=UPI003F7CF87D
MKKTVILGTVFTLVLILVMPFVGGSGPSLIAPANAAASDVAALPVAATGPVAGSDAAPADAVAVRAASMVQTSGAPAIPDTEHLAQKPVPKPVVVTPQVAATREGGTAVRRAARAAAGTACPSSPGGGGGAPGIADPLGQGMITGTTTGDIQSFSATYNAIRVQNCLDPIPAGNFRYDSCMEDRLFWIAEDPSLDPNSAWGHSGTPRSDGVPARGCDGNLAGGSGNSGATVAQKWWDSIPHRLSLYRPSYTGGTGGVCIYFAMVHGGIPNEPSSFTRAAARWGGC